MSKKSKNKKLDKLTLSKYITNSVESTPSNVKESIFPMLPIDPFMGKELIKLTTNQNIINQNQLKVSEEQVDHLKDLVKISSNKDTINSSSLEETKDKLLEDERNEAIVDRLDTMIDKMDKNPISGKKEKDHKESPKESPSRNNDNSSNKGLLDDLLDKSSFGKYSKYIKVGGSVLAGGISAYEKYEDLKARDDLSTGQKTAQIAGTGVGTAGGAWAGATAGAALGSVVPGLGTVVGGLGGMLIGGLLGDKLGSSIGESISNFIAPKVEKQEKILDEQEKQLKDSKEINKKQKSFFDDLSNFSFEGMFNSVKDFASNVGSTVSDFGDAVGGKVKTSLKALSHYTGLDKIKAFSMFSETGNADGNYNTAKDIGDNAGVSFGAYQMTEKSGNVNKFLTEYAKSTGDKEAQKFADMTKGGKLTSGEDKQALSAYLNKVGNTEQGKKVQDDIYKEKYLQPAIELAERYGIKDQHGIAHVVDHSITSGMGGAERMLKIAEGMSGGGAITPKVLAEARKKDYQNIAFKNGKQQFLPGWTDRVSNLNTVFKEGDTVVSNGGVSTSNNDVDNSVSKNDTILPDSDSTKVNSTDVTVADVGKDLNISSPVSGVQVSKAKEKQEKPTTVVNNVTTSSVSKGQEAGVVSKSRLDDTTVEIMSYL